MIHDLAHIGHAELLTPKPDESLRFFEQVLGMEVEAREEQSVYLRGWGDYQRYSLKLTESERAGLGHMALRAWSPEALERRVAAIEKRRARPGLDRRRPRATARPTASPTPTGIRSSSTSRPRSTSPPEHLRPTLKNQPQRYVARGAAVKRLDHVNVLALDVAQTGLRAGRARLPALRADRAGRRHRGRRLDEPHDRRARADLRQGRPWVRGRLHHLAFWVDTREEVLRAADMFLDNDVADRGGAVEARDRAGLLPVRLRAGRQPHRGDARRLLRLRPDPEPTVWTEAERAKGQAWGVKTVESFHTYGT